MTTPLSSTSLAPPESLADRLPEEWASLLASWGERPYRGLQIFRWIHHRAVFEPDHMTDLPARLRMRLRQEGLRPPLRMVGSQFSHDGTTKLLAELQDGCRAETVLMPQAMLGTSQARTHGRPRKLARPQSEDATLVAQCVSSQVGCAMGCTFCASGLGGLQRQMTAGEIVSQVLLGRAAAPGPARLGGVVFMGMGEPLHNYRAVARSLLLLSHPEGLGLAMRRITVSTCGLVRQIERLGRDFGGQVQLAVSIHGADDATRSRLMPVNRAHPLRDLLGAVRHYPRPGHRVVTIEYTLVKGVNDSSKDAIRLARLLRGSRVNVNLIPMNPVPETGLSGSSGAVVDDFQSQLRKAGIKAFVRKRRGADIGAACGQLALPPQMPPGRVYALPKA